MAAISEAQPPQTIGHNNNHYSIGKPLMAYWPFDIYHGNYV